MKIKARSTFLTLIICCLTWSAKADFGAFVRIQNARCAACEFSTSQLVTRLKTMNVSFVLKEKFAPLDSVFLATYQIEKVILSDSLFYSMNPSFHSAVVLCNGKEVGRTILEKEADVQKVTRMLAFPCLDFSHEGTTVLSGSYGNSLRFASNGDALAIIDVFNKNLTWLEGDQIYKITFKDVPFDTLLKGRYDAAAFQFYLEVDSIVKHSKIPNQSNFGSVYFDEDTLNVLTSLQTYIKAKKSIQIYRELVLLKFFQGDYSGAVWVNENKRKHVIDDQSGYIRIDNNYYFKAQERQTKKRTKPIKIYAMDSDGELRFVRNAPFKFPQDLINNLNDELDLTSSRSSLGLFYFFNSIEIFDVAVSKTIQMPLIFDPIDIEVIKNTGRVKQSQLAAGKNSHYYFSVFLDNDKYFLTATTDDNKTSKQHLMPIEPNGNLYFSFSSTGLFVFNGRENTLGYYPFFEL